MPERVSSLTSRCSGPAPPAAEHARWARKGGMISSVGLAHLGYRRMLSGFPHVSGHNPPASYTGSPTANSTPHTMQLVLCRDGRVVKRNGRAYVSTPSAMRARRRQRLASSSGSVGRGWSTTVSRIARSCAFRPLFSSLDIGRGAVIENGGVALVVALLSPHHPHQPVSAQKKP